MRRWGPIVTVSILWLTMAGSSAPLGAAAVPRLRNSPQVAREGVARALHRSDVQPGRVGRAWVAIGAGPTRSQLDRYAPKVSLVVLNSWDTKALARIRAINPRAIVLVYQDLASVRNYPGAVVNGHDAAHLPTGVGYERALRHPSWFATDSSGRRIQWSGYTDHWQMAVWNADYQAAWAKNVVKTVTADGWDGVLADNDMSDLSYYSDAILSPETTLASSNELLRRGLARLVEMVGRRLAAVGKLTVPNISDGRLRLAQWREHTVYGGGMDENFAHFGTRADAGYLGDWPSGWLAQTKELSAPLTLLVTRAGARDTRSLRYGYASALVRARGRVFWTASTLAARPYSRPESFSWQSYRLGRPLGSSRETGGVWWRPFKKALIAVNPTADVKRFLTPRRFGHRLLTVGSHDARHIPATSSRRAKGSQHG